MRKPAATTAFLAALAVSTFALGTLTARPPRPQVSTAAPAARLASAALLPESLPAAPLRQADPDADLPPVVTYEDALSAIHSRYYGTLPKDPEYTTDQVLTYAAIRGLLGSLGDRYTRFLTPGEYKEMMDENRGEFSGIGAHLNARSRDVIVEDTIEGSPARKAGVKPGDRIIKVDNTPVTRMTVDDAVKLIRGERGTTVRLTIVRKGVARPLVISVVRDIVEFDAGKTAVLPGGIGYMSLNSFNDQSDRRVGQALATLEKQHVKGLIFDLRSNPGGLLEQAVAISSRFVSKGPIVWIKERGGKPESMDAQPVRRSAGNLPVVVLINKYSASASEIVAGAIKDTHRGTLVGTTTWGKGLVQTINPIATDNSAVLITTHRYYTPAMVDINKKGIDPDVSVPLPIEEYARLRQSGKLTDDPQVKKAMEVLNRQP